MLNSRSYIFNYAGFDERLEITRKTNKSRLEYLEHHYLTIEKGQVSELDKLQAERLYLSEAQMYSLEREIVVVENAINVLLGQTYAPVTRGLLNDQQQLPVRNSEWYTLLNY